METSPFNEHSQCSEALLHYVIIATAESNDFVCKEGKYSLLIKHVLLLQMWILVCDAVSQCLVSKQHIYY